MQTKIESVLRYLFNYRSFDEWSNTGSVCLFFPLFLSYSNLMEILFCNSPSGYYWHCYIIVTFNNLVTSTRLKIGQHRRICGYWNRHLDELVSKVTVVTGQGSYKDEFKTGVTQLLFYCPIDTILNDYNLSFLRNCMVSLLARRWTSVGNVSVETRSM